MPSLYPARLPPGHPPGSPQWWRGGSPFGRGSSRLPAEKGSKPLLVSLPEAPGEAQLLTRQREGTPGPSEVAPVIRDGVRGLCSPLPCGGAQ